MIVDGIGTATSTDTDTRTRGISYAIPKMFSGTGAITQSILVREVQCLRFPSWKTLTSRRFMALGASR